MVWLSYSFLCLASTCMAKGLGQAGEGGGRPREKGFFFLWLFLRRSCRPVVFSDHNPFTSFGTVRSKYSSLCSFPEIPKGKQAWFLDFSRNLQTSHIPPALCLLCSHSPGTTVGSRGRGPCHCHGVMLEDLGPWRGIPQNAQLLTRGQHLLATECSPNLSELSSRRLCICPAGSVCSSWKRQKLRPREVRNRGHPSGTNSCSNTGLLGPDSGILSTDQLSCTDSSGIKESTLISDFLLL